MGYTRAVDDVLEGVIIAIKTRRRQIIRRGTVETVASVQDMNVPRDHQVQ